MTDLPALCERLKIAISRQAWQPPDLTIMPDALSALERQAKELEQAKRERDEAARLSHQYRSQLERLEAALVADGAIMDPARARKDGA